MKFSNYINEIFDNPYRYKVEKESYGITGKFYDEEGGFFIVNFDYDNVLHIETFGDKEEKIADALLLGDMSNAKKTVDIAFDKDGRYEMTKSNAFRVFATIKAIMDDSKSELKSYGKDGITFQGKTNDAGRIKFYKTLLLYVKKEFKFKYTSIYDHHRGKNKVFFAYNDPDLNRVLES